MAAPEIGALAWATADCDDAEARLAALARSGGPLRRASAALAGRLVATRGWERLGYARPGDYARERLGVSGRMLHELARVDHGLAVLPRLEAALVSGALPWSKLRLLARFATADDEAHWIKHAQRVSVRALEHQVRRVDRGALGTGGLASDDAQRALATDEEGGDLEPVERIRLRGPLAMGFQWQRTREYAARVAGEAVTPGTVLEMVTAETLSAIRLDADAPDDASPVEGISWSDVAAASGPEPGREHDPGPEARGSQTEEVACLPPDPDAQASPAPKVELPAFLQPLVAGLAEADAFELDARLRRALRLEQRLDAGIAPLLRHVTGSEFAWRGAYQTLAHYARERLGMSPRKARALVQLERVGDACPELRAAWRSGALSWVQAHTLAPLLGGDAVGDARHAWVAFAPRVSVRRLEAVVDHARLLCDTQRAPRAFGLAPEPIDARLGPSPDPDADLGSSPDADADLADIPGAGRQTCARNREIGERADVAHAPLPTERQTCAQHRAGGSTWWERCRITVTAPREVARLFRAALCTVRRARERETGRLPSEAEAFAAMLDHALASWGADDPRLRRRLAAQYRVFERDGWRCTVPGCTSRRNLHAHHVRFRSAGGTDALANQTTLCAWHHQRGVHAGLVRIRGQAPDGLAFELGVRPGRPPLACYGPGERVV